MKLVVIGAAALAVVAFVAVVMRTSGLLNQEPYCCGTCGAELTDGLCDHCE